MLMANQYYYNTTVESMLSKLAHYMPSSYLWDGWPKPIVQFMEGSKKNSYERRDYESVDEKILS